jgi:hypothetical protein
MTEYERGAYSPYDDEELAFDPREMRRRRPVPLTLIASVTVLGILGVAAALFYQSGIRGANEPPRAVGTPVGKFKSMVIQPDAKAADPAALDVYDPSKTPDQPGQTAQPVYVPDPEQPQPRPVAAQPPVAPVTARALPAAAKPPAYASIDDAAAAADAAPPARAAKAPVKAISLAKNASDPAEATPVRAAPKAKATAAAAPAARASVATPAPAPKTLLARAQLAKASTAKAQTPSGLNASKPIKTAAAKPADKGGSGVVQIGAFSSKALADQEFAKIRARFGTFVSGRSTHVEGVQKGTSTLYRAAFTGFSKAQAQAFCDALRGGGHACIVR